MVAALALPPLTLVPLLLISIPGLLALIDGAPSWRRAALRGLVFGIAHHLVGLYWVTFAILVQAAEFWWAVPIAVPLLAAVLAVFIAVPCGLARMVAPGWPRLLGDLAREFVLTGFPWNPLGSVWEMPGVVGLAFMQPAAWVGVGGLTVATLVLAGAPSLGKRSALGAVAAVIVWGAVGFARLQVPAEAAPGLTAVIVQGNISEIEHRDHWRDKGWIEGTFDKHLALTRQGMAQAMAQGGGHPAIVVWPETASPYWLEQDANARAAIAAAARPALATLAGAPREEAPGVDHNSLIVVMPDGSVGGYYDKFHLVPYGEYFPSYLPIRLGERGWDPGPGLKTLHSMLVNITNDSWFGESAGPRQHLAAARMRTVEEGLPMVRAANTGISAIINAHGKVVARLGLDRAGTVVEPIPGPLPRTLFSRLGLLSPGAIATLGCGFGLILGRSRRRGYIKSNGDLNNKNSVPKN